MKAAALCGAGFLLMNATAVAQSNSEALRACTLPSYEERMRCLEKLAAGAAPSSPAAPAKPAPAPPPSPDKAPAPPPVQPAVRNAPAASPAPTFSQRPSQWTVSETRSPYDYSPVATATASSAGTNGVLQLSIECRSGHTEMTIRNAPMMRAIDGYTVVYKINNAPPVGVTIGMSASGSGIALKGDVAGFLLALPAEGVVIFRVADRRGAATEATYDLPGIKAMISRMAEPCNWRRK
jgi:hypothetical protein